MSNRRLRSRALRNALYQSTGGRCAICGEPLPSNWHADHIEPWALSQRTNVHGMQPLCPECNVRKGATVSRTPRPFQAEMAQRAAQLAQSGHRVLIADVHPGSGKTEGYLMAALALWRQGYIKQLVVFTPRLNLAIQAEMDWARLRAQTPGPTFGPITRRPNVLPLLKAVEGGEMPFGYATTYGSLMAQPQLHVDFATSSPTLVIFDEAQQLGDNAAFPDQGTRSAAVARDLAVHASFTFVLSGTPYRADGNPLILAEYLPPDDQGFRKLLSHVRADYLTGVRSGYLCQFEATLHDGRGIWEYMGEEPETLELSTMEKGLGKVLRQRGYWEPLVDRFVEKLRDYQEELHPKVCGLIAASRQDQATDIIKYVERTHRGLRVLLAVSDEEAAQDNLRRFQQGKADVLVTVAMAHVGFDHQPIKVILPLTTVRSEAWLRQLFARGLRMWNGPDGLPVVDRDLQTCWIIAPDDVLMSEMVDKMRAESRAGVIEREEDERARREDRERGPSQQRLGAGKGAELTDTRAKGMLDEGDTGRNEFQFIQSLRTTYQVPKTFPDTRLAAMLRQYAGVAPAGGNAPPPPRPPLTPDFRTAQERENEKREQVRRAAVGCDRFMMQHDPNWRYGYANAEAKRHFGKPVDACGFDELDARLAFFKTFLIDREKFYGA